MSDTDVAAGVTFGQNSLGYLFAQSGLGPNASRYTSKIVESRAAHALALQLRQASWQIQALRALTNAPSTPMRVLAAGNSMTVGPNMGNVPLALAGGYRPYLGFAAELHGRAIEWSQCAENGRTLDQLRSALPAAVAAASPNVVLIHMGTTTPSAELATYQSRYLALIDSVLAVPDVRVCCAAVQLSWPDASSGPGIQSIERAANDAIRAAVESRSSTGRVVLCDMSTGLQENTFDGIHPTDFGYLWMATRWEASLVSAGWL